MRTDLMFVLSLWKGRRKEKDVPSPVHEEYRPYLNEECVHEKITDTDVNHMVSLPDGLDYNEWLATHTISFFEHINLMYGSVSEFCTSTGCGSMTAPCNTQYLWTDEKGKKCKCPAPQYVDYVMSFSQKTLLDESVFPTKYGNVFPCEFDTVARKVLRYMFHVLAHIYHAHFKEIVCMNAHGHLNTLFLHFIAFVKKFDLIDEKELCILNDLHSLLEGKVLDSNENKENQESQPGSAQGSPKAAQREALMDGLQISSPQPPSEPVATKGC